MSKALMEKVAAAYARNNPGAVTTVSCVRCGGGALRRLQGRGEIALRRLFDDTVVRFQVTGGAPAIVDMPAMWAHSITNTGDTELMTLFWVHELFDPARPDTFTELVAR